MFELEIIQADFLKEVNVITVEAKVKGTINSPLIKIVLVDKENTHKKFILKGPMFVDGPNVKRAKDHLFLAIDGKDHALEDIIGRTLIPLNS